MDKLKIKSFIESFQAKQNRTIVIIDYGNVEKWKISLGWIIDIKKLGHLVKSLSKGSKFLRRFYYGADYGQSEKSFDLSEWSRAILEKADWSGFEVISKRVKYIHSSDNKMGFEKKCDLDVEMAVDLIKEKDNYDTIVIFSGDGDLVYAIKYLTEQFGKQCYVFGARNHIGSEVFDALYKKNINDIMFVEDLEYRLNKDRGTY